MLIYLLILVLLTLESSALVTPNSPLMNNLATFTNKFAAKVDINPMFHYYHNAHLKGICSSKGGPYCSFVNPHWEFKAKIPLTQEMTKVHTQLHLSMDAILNAIKPEYFSKENPETLFIASPDMVKFDAYIKSLL